MKITALCSTKFFKIDQSVINFTFNHCVLSEDLELLNNIINNEKFVFTFGLISYRELTSNPYFTTVYQIDNEPLDYRKQVEMNTSEAISSSLQMLIFCLWFVRDNSANVSNVYTYVPEMFEGHVRSRETIFSTAKGEYISLIFNTQEIETAVMICNKITELQAVKQSEDETIEEPNSVRLGGYESILYNSLSRIDRAYLFLMLARSKSYLPLKISFYVAILECLFTTDNNEVSHKVTERTTLYLGGDEQSRLENFKLIKTAYGIRSKFVHGQQLEKKFKTKSDLVDISVQIDSLLRELLTKIIIKDSDLFLQSDDKLNDWFTKLILSTSE